MDLSVLLQAYQRAQSLRVAVVGETIIDRFVPVSYEGPSMKSACTVYRLRGSADDQEGGAGAVANHLRDFVGEVDFFTNPKGSVVKTRYIDVNTGAKHVEINHFAPEAFPAYEIDTSDYDLTIVADFGHGLCDKLTINDGFHLMCQTNSNNFGYNRVSKWKQYHKRSVCLDLREGSLQLNRKLDGKDPDQVLELYNYELRAEDMYLTIGAAGALYTDGHQVVQQASFPSKVVDTIGAGDAFFAFACLSSALNIPPDHRMTIPALAASLTTTWLCNEHAVTQSKLQTYATQFVQNGLSPVPRR